MPVSWSNSGRSSPHQSRDELELHVDEEREMRPLRSEMEVGADSTTPMDNGEHGYTAVQSPRTHHAEAVAATASRITAMLARRPPTATWPLSPAAAASSSAPLLPLQGPGPMPRSSSSPDQTVALSELSQSPSPSASASGSMSASNSASASAPISFRSMSRFQSLRRLHSAMSHQTDSDHSTNSHENGSHQHNEDCGHRHSYHHGHGHPHHHDDPSKCSAAEATAGDATVIGLRPEGAPNSVNCPSSHYYIDSQGRLQARRMWWLYTRTRRLCSHLLPGFRRDSNSYLCALMISNTCFIIGTYVLRLVVNAVLNSLLSQEQELACHDFSAAFLDFFSYSLLGNVLLCLPAFNIPICKLFRRVQPARIPKPNEETADTETTPVAAAAINTRDLERDADGAESMDSSATPTGRGPVQPGVVAAPATAAAADGAVVHDDENPKLRKTFLFTLCEAEVIFEIPYLVYTFFTILFPDAMLLKSANLDTDLLNATKHCANQLPALVFSVFCLSQLIGLLAYMLRWNQIILFHRMHEHFLYQRGSVPGRARFDYVEESFRVPWWRSAKQKRIHTIKAQLYRAAKYDDVDEVRRQMARAVALDGPDFAQRWYKVCDQEGWFWRLFGPRFSTCQRNPLHVAVAFDNAEVVQTLLSPTLEPSSGVGYSRGYNLGAGFDIHQVEKMELLKLNISWLYRMLFDIIPPLRKSNHARHKTRLVFGPVNLLCSTLITPLHVAVSMGNTDMVLLLLRCGANPNLDALSTRIKFRTPPLFWAINKDCTRLLLDADANPLYVPGNGYYLTAFEVARIVGNHAVSAEIEKYGGDVALTPLHDASARGFKEEVRFYLEHGASPDSLGEKVTGYFRRTPLHWAAIRGEAKTVKLLLKFGAAVDARDAFGRTPLTWACLLNRVNAVKVLLKYDADVNVRDMVGDPLLCICAAGTNITAMTMALFSNTNGGMPGGFRTGDGTRNPSSTSTRALDPMVFALLQDYGIDLRATRSFNGDTALHVALRKNNEATSILFVRAGMALTEVNYLGQRAMDCTTSPSLRYAIKKEAGHRDVMISYCHSHGELARKVRDALEAAHVTTWIDSMDPSGITGGSVWRQEIAQGIRSSALVLALLTPEYPRSQWCMKELAFAKMHNVPIVAIQCADMIISEELQVYLWTRQVVDFRQAIIDGGDQSNDGAGNDDDAAVHKGRVAHSYDEAMFDNCMRLLLDGIHDRIEEHRVRKLHRQKKERSLLTALSSGLDDASDGGEDDLLSTVGESTRGGGRRKNLTGISGGGDVTPPSPTLHSPASSRFVFIAHGDYHLSFCKKIRKSLAKQGIRCVVDQSVPVVQSTNTTTNNDATVAPETRTTPPPGVVSFLSRTSSQGTTTRSADNVSSSVQARQLAAKDSIIECSAVIVVLSPLSSKCDMLADQLAFAEDRGKLIVPLLLSLQQIDLAKRYTFSRSVVQHFNVSIGYEQSLDQLAVYLQQSVEASQRQQQPFRQSQQPLRQSQLHDDEHHTQRDRRRQSLPAILSTQNHQHPWRRSTLAALTSMDEGANTSVVSSPTSSVRSSSSHVSATGHGMPPPLSISPPQYQISPVETRDSQLPSPIPILHLGSRAAPLTPFSQPTTSQGNHTGPTNTGTGGHGWTRNVSRESSPSEQQHHHQRRPSVQDYSHLVQYQQYQQRSHEEEFRGDIGNDSDDNSPPRREFV